MGAQEGQAQGLPLRNAVINMRCAMLTSVVNTRGQITIPAQIRRQLNLKPGIRFRISIKENKLTLIPKINNIKAAFGLCRAQYQMNSIKKVHLQNDD